MGRKEKQWRSFAKRFGVCWAKYTTYTQRLNAKIDRHFAFMVMKNADWSPYNLNFVLLSLTAQESGSLDKNDCDTVTISAKDL